VFLFVCPEEGVFFFFQGVLKPVQSSEKWDGFVWQLPPPLFAYCAQKTFFFPFFSSSRHFSIGQGVGGPPIVRFHVPGTGSLAPCCLTAICPGFNSPLPPRTWTSLHLVGAFFDSIRFLPFGFPFAAFFPFVNLKALVSAWARRRLRSPPALP